MSDVNNWQVGRYCATCSLLLPLGATDHTCIETAPKRDPDYFAHKIFDSSGKEVYHPSRRDYFAAAALQGLLAYPEVLMCEEITRLSVRYADAVIEALDKEK